MKVVVLGAGFAGLELSTRLSEALGDEVEVTLIDRSEGFVFGFSKLDVMFGRTTPDAVLHRYVDVVKPGVTFVAADITRIDPEHRRVETSAGTFDGDILVVALGAELEPSATPGLVEGGYEFYTEAGAFALRDVLANFAGGRVIVAVCSTPFKCPPAPSETVLLVHDLLVRKGIRDQSEVHLVTPLPVPIPPSPPASQALLGAFAERGIEFHGGTVVRGLDPARKVALLGDEGSGGEMPYDLFLGVPKHKVPAVVAESGMTVDGWIPVDPLTLETPVPGRLRGRRRDQRRYAEGRGVLRRPGRGRRRPDHRRSSRWRRPDVRRGRDLLPRVRRRPGRRCRGDVPGGPGAVRNLRRPVRTDRRAEGRFRDQPRPPMVRQGLGRALTSAVAHLRSSGERCQWDDRYRERAALWSGNPNGALVAEVPT